MGTMIPREKFKSNHSIGLDAGFVCLFWLGGSGLLKSVVGLDEFPSPLALAGRIQPFSQLLGLSYVIGVHRDVAPTALRSTGTGPCEGGAAGPSCHLH